MRTLGPQATVAADIADGARVVGHKIGLTAAEDVVRPIMSSECVLGRLALILGYAGVYSSFLKHAQRAAEEYGVPGAAILRECGARGLIGGQEDLIPEIAYELQQRLVATAPIS
jgi:4-hydroxy 2-oxovalerate aldolase